MEVYSEQHVYKSHHKKKKKLNKKTIPISFGCFGIYFARESYKKVHKIRLLYFLVPFAEQTKGKS